MCGRVARSFTIKGATIKLQGSKILQRKATQKCRSAKTYTWQYSLIGPLGTRVSYILTCILSELTSMLHRVEKLRRK